MKERIMSDVDYRTSGEIPERRGEIPEERARVA
jgi:hypothetical protein